MDVISSGEVNTIPMDEDSESVQKFLKRTLHSSILAAYKSVQYLRKNCSVGAMTALSLISALSIRKKPTEKEIYVIFN